MDLQDKLVRNEQAKLTATYFNGIAVALAAVGGIAPWIGVAQSGALSPLVATVTLGCAIASLVIHFGARAVLRRMVV